MKGGAVIQAMNDAFTKAELTRLSIGPVRFLSLQRVKAGNLMVQIDAGAYEAQVTQAK